MALAATDIISLTEAKMALRFVGDSADHDALITTSIAAAVEWIDEQTKCGILARRFQIKRDDLRRQEPVTIALKHNADVSDLFYQYPDLNDGIPDATEMPVDDDHVYRRVGRVLITPPDTGWQSPRVTIRGIFSIAPEHAPPALTSTAIMVMRRLYDGDEQIKQSWTVQELLKPYLDFAGGAPGLIVTERVAPPPSPIPTPTRTTTTC